MKRKKADPFGGFLVDLFPEEFLDKAKGDLFGKEMVEEKMDHPAVKDCIIERAMQSASGTMGTLLQNNNKASNMEEEKKQKSVKLVNTEINTINGVVISGGNNEVTITINKDGSVEASSKKKEMRVPEVLQTPMAREVIMKFQGAGWLDEAMQPKGMKREQMAVLAHSIAERLGIANVWSVFEELWGIKALSSAYQKGVNRSDMGEFMGEIEKILK